jgi:hypothetical protein
MEPVTSAITTKAASRISAAVTKNGESFIKAVLHAPAKALGGLVADRISERRHANLIKIAARSKEWLREAGISAHEVPLSIIHPALEAASLAEDEDLQNIWANLLANTADNRQRDSISPSFPLILKELGARDVKFLDVLYQHADDTAKKRPPNSIPMHQDQKMQREHFNIFEMRHLYADQVLNIKKQRPRDREEDAFSNRYFKFSLDLAMRHRLLDQAFSLISAERKSDLPDVGSIYLFSVLGARFVAACRPPVRAK